MPNANPRALPFTARFGSLERRFSTQIEAQQWIADRLGKNPSCDDYAIIEDGAFLILEGAEAGMGEGEIE